jgi:hypothetical protein
MSVLLRPSMIVLNPNVPLAAKVMNDPRPAEIYENGAPKKGTLGKLNVACWPENP